VGPETNYSHMSQLLRPGETALFIFTKGNCLKIDDKDGSGYTGWWKVNILRICRVDWIFIYYKLNSDYNELYMAHCGDLQGPNQDGKYQINLRGAKQVGHADANWPDFGGDTVEASDIFHNGNS
jgi:hypothetical protein